MSLNLNPNFAEPGQRYFHKFSPGDDFYEMLMNSRERKKNWLRKIIFCVRT